MKKLIFAIFLMITVACEGNARSQAATGVYPYGSFDHLGFDTINVGNSNVHFAIPIFSKQGRGGQNFSYSLSYDSLFWQIDAYGPHLVWTPHSFGWQTDQAMPITGHMSSYSWSVFCSDTGPNADPRDGHWTNLSTSFVYYAPDGAVHNYPGILGEDCDGTQLSPDRGYDGSVVIDATHLRLANGTMLTVATSAGTASSTDKNGNVISWNNGTFTDTTGNTVLTVADGVYTYPDATQHSHSLSAHHGKHGDCLHSVHGADRLRVPGNR